MCAPVTARPPQRCSRRHRTRGPRPAPLPRVFCSTPRPSAHPTTLPSHSLQRHPRQRTLDPRQGAALRGRAASRGWVAPWAAPRGWVARRGQVARLERAPPR
eukprot:scaffold7474_cov63-Phaeocystis_antarctica.AAC.5